MNTVLMGGDLMALRALSDILWHERDLLETLRYKLEVEQLVLAGGLASRLPIATREVEQVLEEIRSAEVGRALEAEAAARYLGIPTDASLREIAAASASPWDELFAEHHREFLALTAAISELAKSNHSTLAAVHQATQETLMSLQESVETYDRRGTTRQRQTDGQIVDESL